MAMAAKHALSSKVATLHRVLNGTKPLSRIPFFRGVTGVEAAATASSLGWESRRYESGLSGTAADQTFYSKDLEDGDMAGKKPRIARDVAEVRVTHLYESLIRCIKRVLYHYSCQLS